MKEYKHQYTPDERKQLIAGQLLFLRSQKGLTQKEVSKIIGVKLGTYNAYEKARSEPSGEIIVRLAYLYDVSTDVILQKDNLLKDPNELNALTEEYEKAIKIIQDKIAEGKPEDIKMINEELGKNGNTLKNLLTNIVETK